LSAFGNIMRQGAFNANSASFAKAPDLARPM